MAMKWFSNAWYHGVKTEEEFEWPYKFYLEHCSHTTPLVPENLRRFLGEQVNGRHTWIHDATVVEWEDSSPDAFTITWDCPHEQTEDDFERLTVVYSGNVELFDVDSDQIATWLNDPETEFIFDELEIVGEDRFEHRHLMLPKGDFGVRFSTASVTSELLPWHRYST